MSVVDSSGRAVDVASVRRPTRQHLERTRALQVVAMRRQGCTVVQIARYFSVSRRTVYRWIEGMPEEAVAMARRVLD